MTQEAPTTVVREPCANGANPVTDALSCELAGVEPDVLIVGAIAILVMLAVCAVVLPRQPWWRRFDDVD